MLAPARSVLFGAPGTINRKIATLGAFLALANVAVWTWALIALRHSPAMLGTALLAYSFGLRHAIDADHIAAIDNVTRKLMNDGKRPVAVGFFFALGHSLVVIIGSIGIALTTNALNHRLAAFKAIGATIGTSVSAFFLLAIALLNVILLGEIYRSFQRVRSGQQPSNDPSVTQVSGNFLARFFRPLFRLIESSWQMLPLGFLFGMGFETATEIGLLGTSAAQASAGISMWTILVFPCLFTVGMLTLDATDGVLMLSVYGWALVKPIRKLYYNMIITLVSTLVALVIGGIQALGLLGQKLNLAGPFWSLIETLNGGFGTLGYVIIAIFIGSWLISAASGVICWRPSAWSRWRRKCTLPIPSTCGRSPRE